LWWINYRTTKLRAPEEIVYRGSVYKTEGEIKHFGVVLKKTGDIVKGLDIYVEKGETEIPERIYAKVGSQDYVIYLRVFKSQNKSQKISSTRLCLFAHPPGGKH
ncbi:MAG: hypothetical protein AB1466_03355, partial [Actinomycetota bacterium]